MARKRCALHLCLRLGAPGARCLRSPRLSSGLRTARGRAPPLAHLCGGPKTGARARGRDTRTRARARDVSVGRGRGVPSGRDVSPYRCAGMGVSLNIAARRKGCWDEGQGQPDRAAEGGSAPRLEGGQTEECGRSPRARSSVGSKRVSPDPLKVYDFCEVHSRSSRPESLRLTTSLL